MTTTLYRFCQRAAVASALLIAVTGLGAWDDADPNDRPEFVTRGVGDAIATNKATQTIDPWPKYVRDRNYYHDGQRAALSMQRYQQNRVAAPHATNTTAAPVQQSFGSVAPSGGEGPR